MLIPPAADPAAASTGSSSSAATIRARGCRCCSRPGPRSAAAPARALRIVGADPLAVRLLLPAHARRRRRHRRARLPLAGGADGRAAAGEGAGRAVDRRRELRHGADARVRVRDAGGRVRHPGVRGVDDAETGGAVPAGRRAGAWPTRSSAARGRAAAARARRRGAARSRASGTRGTRSPGGSSRSTSRCWRALMRAALAAIAAEPRSRSSCSSSAGVDRPALVARAALDASATRSRRSSGVGRRRGRVQPALDRRARVRLEDGDPSAMPPPHPRFRLVFSAFCVGPARERRAAGPVGELARVARARPADAAAAGALGDARRHGLRAPRLRPRPGAAARRLRRCSRRTSRTGRSRA